MEKNELKQQALTVSLYSQLAGMCVGIGLTFITVRPIYALTLGVVAVLSAIVAGGAIHKITGTCD